MGFALNEKLTSAQINDIDAKTANSVDKTVAGDTVSGALAFASGSSIHLVSGAELALDTGSIITGIPRMMGTLMMDGGGAELDFDAGANIRGDPTLIGAMTVSGVGAKIATASSGRIELGDSDFPQLAVGHTGRSRADAQSTLSQYPTANGGTWARSINGTPGFEHTDAAAGSSFSFYLSELHNGATLSSLQVWFKPSNGARGGSLAGISAPYVTITRYGAFTNNAAEPASVQLLSTTFGTLSFPSHADYIAQKLQRITYTCDQNNVIDTTQYTYCVVVFDETGGAAASGNVYTMVVANYTTITDMRFQ